MLSLVVICSLSAVVERKMVSRVAITKRTKTEKLELCCHLRIPSIVLSFCPRLLMQVEKGEVTAVLLVCKWGGEMTHAGIGQARQYAPVFWDDM